MHLSSSSSSSTSPSTASPAADFSGLWIPLVTPFRDGAVDHVALAGLVEHLAGTGIAGFVVCGSTGEAAALDADEQLAVLATVTKAAPSLPRIMGISGYHLGKTLDWVRQLSRRELAGLLVPAPSYIRPSQDGLRLWFEAIAETSAQPLLIYDIPYRTGSVIALETLLALAAHPRIRAIKDCGGDPPKTRALMADGRLQMLAGEDAQLFGTLAEGGSGAIAASAHLQTTRFVDLVAHLLAGRLNPARELWRTLAPWVEALFAEPNPGPLKAMLAMEGRMQDELRAPMSGPSSVLRERLRRMQGPLNRR